MNAPPVHYCVGYQKTKNDSVLLFWESGGEGQKLGTDFGFESQQLNFGGKKVSCKIGRKRIKTRKWRAQISANAIKIRTTDGNPCLFCP